MHVLVVKSHIWRLSLFVTWCSAFNSVWLQLMCHFLFYSYAFLGGVCVFPSGSLIQSWACAFVLCFLLPRSASVSSLRCSDRFLCSCRDSELSLKSEFYFQPWKGKVRSGCRDGVCVLLLSAYEQRLKTLSVFRCRCDRVDVCCCSWCDFDPRPAAFPPLSLALSLWWCTITTSHFFLQVCGVKP